MATTKQRQGSRSRYEFRVWGDQDIALERLSRLAESEYEQQLEDCYLLVHDPGCNVKIRRNRLKVKQLVEERFGFQRWTTDWHRITVDTNATIGDGAGPGPDFAPMGQAGDPSTQLLPEDGQSNLIDVVSQLDPHASLRPVFVTKYRRRFRFGSMRAEVADLEVGGRSGRLCTTAIEGRNLLDLIQLRSALGFDLTPNVAVHLALTSTAPSSSF